MRGKQLSNNIRERTVTEYYESLGSRLGYRYILGGTKHFGLYGPNDSKWSFGPAMRRMEQRLVETLGLTSGQTVLDAGCGMGDVACYVASHSDANVVGIDILDFNLEEARNRISSRGLNGQVEVLLMDYSKLDFPDASFDAVYTMETLVHARDAQQVLSEFYRVLKPGGRLVHFEYAHAPMEQMPTVAQKAISVVNELASMPSFQRFSYGVLEQDVADSGFEHITSTDITELMKPMVRAFYLMARVPYAVTRRLGRPDIFVNAMSAVELWRIIDYLRYSIIVGTKPKS